MTDGSIMELATDAIVTVLKVAAPILIVSIIVGLVISIIQTTTSIQEQTITFVPKLFAIFIALLVFGGYMINTLRQYTMDLFSSLWK
jgi:flagellar biosynthetic protein FliQ